MLVSRLALLALGLTALPFFAQDEQPVRQGAFFAIVTPDADASVAWYEEHFGFQLVSQHDMTERQIKMRNLTRDGAWLEVIERPDASEPGDGGVAIGIFKSGFYVDDIETLHRALTNSAVDVDRLIESEGSRFFTLRDLDGNRLQVFERRKG